MEKDQTFKLNAPPAKILDSVNSIRDSLVERAKEDKEYETMAAFYEDLSKLVEVAVRAITPVNVMPIIIDPNKLKN
jgi:hypothetical protein